MITLTTFRAHKRQFNKKMKMIMKVIKIIEQKQILKRLTVLWAMIEFMKENTQGFRQTIKMITSWQHLENHLGIYLIIYLVYSVN